MTKSETLGHTIQTSDKPGGGENKRETVTLDIERDLSINKFKLDMECVSNPSLYFRYGEAAQQAKSRVNELEDKLKLVMAEQNIVIRNDFIQQGIKYTESVIDAELTKDKKAQSVKDQLREAQKEAAVLSVAVSAFDSRRSALDNLVKLYTSGYWSQPSGNRDTVNDQAGKEIRRGLNKHKKTED